MNLVKNLTIYTQNSNYPLITQDDAGMLIDILQTIINMMDQSIQIIYTNQTNQSDIILQFNKNYDTEKGVTLINDQYNIDYKTYDISNSLLQENYVFIFPSLLITLFTRIIWQLFINYLLIVFPWVMFNANLLVFFQSNKFKSYPSKIITSLQILIGNEQTTLCTLIFKIYFLISIFCMSSIIFIDFIYVVGNTIQRQNFNSLNDLAINQFKLCIVDDDQFVESMITRYRHLDYVKKANIQSCIDIISKSDEVVLFVSEFKYGTYLQMNPQFNNFYKYALKQNSYKSYNCLMNLTLPYQFRLDFNATVIQMQYDKYDLEVRSKYLVQIIYVKQNLVSLIFSNKSFLLFSLCISLILLLLIQCSILKKQYKTLRNKLPYKFLRNI